MQELEQWKEQASHLWHVAMDYLREVPPEQLYAAAAIAIFTTLLLLSLRLFRRSKSNTIVLTGLSGSGKTVLFYQLRDGSTHQGTVTSMEPNEGTFILHGETTKKGKIKPVHIVDVPGHSRLRPKLDEYLPQAAGIVFVVDALDFLPNCRSASEYLYDLLTKGRVVKKKIPLLILCNKTDKVTAHTKEFIRRQLEKEFDRGRFRNVYVRRNRAGRQGSLHSASNCLGAKGASNCLGAKGASNCLGAKGASNCQEENCQVFGAEDDQGAKGANCPSAITAVSQKLPHGK